MCEPMTLGIASLATMAAGTAVSAFSQMQAVKAENKAAEYNAQIQERNAQVARMQAADATARGREEELRQRQQVAKFMGTQKSALAAGGVDVNTGSALTSLQDTAAFGELDALTIRANAGREAWAFENQASDYENSARLSRMGKRSAGLAVGSTLLTGASSLGSSYFGLRQQGVFGSTKKGP